MPRLPQLGRRLAGCGLLGGRSLVPFAACRVGDGQRRQVLGVPGGLGLGLLLGRYVTGDCRGSGPRPGLLGHVLAVADLGLYVGRGDRLGPAVVLNLRLELAAVHRLQQRGLVGQLESPHR